MYAARINIVILEPKYGWFYVDDRNIRGKHLYKDGLYLTEEGKIILARNLIFCLN